MTEITEARYKLFLDGKPVGEMRIMPFNEENPHIHIFQARYSFHDPGDLVDLTDGEPEHWLHPPIKHDSISPGLFLPKDGKWGFDGDTVERERSYMQYGSKEGDGKTGLITETAAGTLVWTGYEWKIEGRYGEFYDHMGSKFSWEEITLAERRSDE